MQAATISPDVASRIQLALSGSPTMVVAGNSLTGTITAYDQYNNTATAYTGDKSITFSGATVAASAPDGQVANPTATDKTTTAVNFGTATTITFTEGVSSSTITIKLKKVEAATLAITDGSISNSTTQYSIRITPAALSVFLASDYPQSSGGQFGTAGYGWDSTSPAGGTEAPYDVTIAPYDAWGNIKYDYTGSVWFSMAEGGVGTFPYDAADNAYTFTWNSSHTDHETRTEKSDTYDNGRHIFDATDFNLSTGGSSVVVNVNGDGAVQTTLYVKINPAAVSTIGIAFSPSLTSDVVDTGLDSNVVVTAYDVLGNVKTDYVGSVFFTSTDSRATLPYTASSKYTFQVSDLGSKSFTGSTFRFGTGGNHTITVADNTTLRGDNSNIPEATTNPVVVPVHPVSNLQATAGHESITLSWDNPVDSAITKVNVYQSTVDGSLGSKITSRTVTASTSSQYTVTGLTNGTTYYYTLKSVHKNPSDQEVEGAGSTQVSGTPADIAPRNVSANQQSDGRVKVDYGLRYDSSIALSYYNPTTAAWSNAATANLTGDAGAGVSGSLNINPHTLYWTPNADFPSQYFTGTQGFKVKINATTGQGTGSTISEDFLLDTNPPRVNSGEQALIVDATGSSTADLTLLAREDGATEQTIQYRISNDQSTWSDWTTLASKPLTVSGWQLAEAGIVYVQFKDPYSNVLTVNNSILTTPTNFSLKDGSSLDTGDYRILLLWSDPEVANFSEFIIERSLDGTTFTQVGTSVKNAYVDVDLDSTTRYSYRAKTADTLGNISRPTTVLSSRPGAAPDVTSLPTITIYNWKQEYGVRALVEWTTDQTSDSFVAYAKEELESGTSTLTKTGSTAQVVGQFDQSTTHSVLLQQLEPSTKYYIKTLSQNEIKITGTSDIVEITTPERIPLVIDGLKFQNTTPTGTQVVWRTNKPSTTVMEYGKVPVYGLAKTDKDLNIDHVITLDDLESGSSYHLRVHATDSDGNTTDSDNYIITIPATPTIQAVMISDLKYNSATITWQTNVNTDSQVEFGKSGEGFSSQQGKSDSTTVHSVTLIGLESAVSYQYRVRSQDQFGNVIFSNNQSFITPADTQAPTLLNTKSEVTTTGSGENIKIMAIISWETDEPATSQVEYGQGISDEYQNKTQEVISFNMTHTVIIPDIRPNASYQFRIISKDAAGNTTKSGDQTIITPTKEKSLLQLVVKSLEETFAWTKRLRDSKYLRLFTNN